MNPKFLNLGFETQRVSIDTQEQESGEIAEETQEFPESEEDFIVPVIEEEQVEISSKSFDYSPPSDRTVLGKVSSYGEEVATAVMEQDGRFSTSQIADYDRNGVSKRWAKDILEEMADAGMVEKHAGGVLHDQKEGVYSPERFTEDDVEEFVETYREKLE